MVRSFIPHHLVGGVLIAIGTVAVPARAQAPPIELRWKAPADCPTQDAVVSEVTRVLGHVPASAPVQARAEVERAENRRWQAQLVLTTTVAQSQRLLIAESCEAIASATALIVAVAIEGGGVPESPQAVQPNIRRQDGQPPVLTPPSGPAYRSQLFLGASGVVDDGAMPAIAGGVELAFGWSGVWRAWHLRLLASAAAFPEQSKLADQPQLATKNEGGDFRLIDASGRACGSIVLGSFDLGPCLGSEFDFMDAWGTPAAKSSGHTSAHASARWVSLSGSALAEWQLARAIALFARVEGLVPLAHPSFVIAQPDNNSPAVVHQPAAGLRLALGLELGVF